MKKRYLLSETLAVLALTLHPLGAKAAVNCQQAVTQLQMDECAGADYDKSNKALQKVYDQIMARLKDSSDERKLLIEAERAWIKYRDAQCEFEASGVRGGSVWPMIYTMCRQGVTEDRTKYLQQFLNCKDGDLSCPVPTSPDSN